MISGELTALLTTAWPVTFPDFLLLDTDPAPLPLEVYGRVNDPAYAARKTAKSLYYRALPGGCWCWDLTRHRTPPVFPPLAACNRPGVG